MTSRQARKLVELIQKSGKESSVALLMSYGLYKFKFKPVIKAQYYWLPR